MSFTPFTSVPYVLLLNLLLGCIAQTVPTSPSLSAVGQGAGIGQDCTYNSAICSRGLLCLNATDPHTLPTGAGPRVCRRPSLDDPCDSVATCDGSGLDITLECLTRLTFSTGNTGGNFFPGRICIQTKGRGESCIGSPCRPGLVCGTGLENNVCVTASQAAFGQDCSDRDCEPNLLCQRFANGSRLCVNLIPTGSACNQSEFDPNVNPCLQTPPQTQDNAGNTACINGRCVLGIPLGAPCTIQDHGSYLNTFLGQCELPYNGNSRYCLKSESQTLRCLYGKGFLEPCSDSSYTGCISLVYPDMQCIRGYCGVSNGGPGDICGSNSSCMPGLTCVQSPPKVPGPRCFQLKDVGDRCGTSSDDQNGICKSNLECKTFPTGFSYCTSHEVPIGGRCVIGKTECRPGLSCVANDKSYSEQLVYHLVEGTCMVVSKLGGSCNPSKYEICHEYLIDLINGTPHLQCVQGKCVQGTTARWHERCGPGTGAQCASHDEIGKLTCLRGTCVHSNVTIGRGCTVTSFFGAIDCAPGLQCDPFNFGTDGYVFRCAQYSADGGRCDYNNYTGCSNANSSCVRGICVSA